MYRIVYASPITYVWKVSLKVFIELILGSPGGYHKDKHSHSPEQVNSRGEEGRREPVERDIWYVLRGLG